MLKKLGYVGFLVLMGALAHKALMVATEPEVMSAATVQAINLAYVAGSDEGYREGYTDAEVYYGGR